MQQSCAKCTPWTAFHQPDPNITLETGRNCLCGMVFTLLIHHVSACLTFPLKSIQKIVALYILSKKTVSLLTGRESHQMQKESVTNYLKTKQLHSAYSKPIIPCFFHPLFLIQSPSLGIGSLIVQKRFG